MEMPPELVEAFDGDEELLAWSYGLRESWQRWVATYVMEPVSAEAKERRCSAMAERLLQTMEAERELPPWLTLRLRRTRDAAAGWERMSLTMRRDFLLVLFGSRSEGARETQILRILEACVRKGRAGRANA